MCSDFNEFFFLDLFTTDRIKISAQSIDNSRENSGSIIASSEQYYVNLSNLLISFDSNESSEYTHTDLIDTCSKNTPPCSKGISRLVTGIVWLI